MKDNLQYIENLGRQARKAEQCLLELDIDQRNNLLYAMADAIEGNSADIIAANELDKKEAQINNMSSALVDRLVLDEKRIKAMAQGLREAAQYPDPLGKVLYESTMPKGMKLKKVSVPMGVIGIIYESRPNVTADAAGLCLKAGNVCILRGGSDAIHSNKAIVSVLQEVLSNQGLDTAAVQLVEDTSRDTAVLMMQASEYIDLLIPRGGANLIASVMRNATIPVIETGTGNCHIFIDESYDKDYAADIVFNAKCSRPGVCNAVETLLVHEKIYAQILPEINEKLKQCNVQIRACEKSIEYFDNAQPAVEQDWDTEYLDYILAVKVVSGIDEAVEHINRHGTKHSEAIITTDEQNKQKFLRLVDASCVYVNASTRFTDGGEFGLGAEIGISTQKLHARGPMGAQEITSYKYIIEGEGQIR